MLKLKLNWISLAGLVLLIAAVALHALDVWGGKSWTVGTLLGPDAPWANVYLWLVLLVLAAIVYLVGRSIWLFRQMNREP